MIQFSEKFTVGFCFINVTKLLIYVTIYLRKVSLLFCFAVVVEIKLNKNTNYKILCMIYKVMVELYNPNL